MKKRVAILISGSGTNMVALVQSMTGDHKARPCLVVSNVPLAAGLEKARAFGIPTAIIDGRAFKGQRAAFEKALSAALVQARPDIICLAGFMRVLSADFTSLWAGRMLNIHPSLLPKYKGLNTHARALEAGDDRAGCSVHEVTAELDSGLVLGAAGLKILSDDTPESLAARIQPLEHRLYAAVLRRFVEGDRTKFILS